MNKLNKFLILITFVLLMLGGISVVVKNNIDNASKVRVDQEKADLKEKIEKDTLSEEKQETIIDLKINQSEIEE